MLWHSIFFYYTSGLKIQFDGRGCVNYSLHVAKFWQKNNKKLARITVNILYNNYHSQGSLLPPSSPHSPPHSPPPSPPHPLTRSVLSGCEDQAQRFDDLVGRGRVGVEAAHRRRVLTAVGSNFGRQLSLQLGYIEGGPFQDFFLKRKKFINS